MYCIETDIHVTQIGGDTLAPELHSAPTVSLRSHFMICSDLFMLVKEVAIFQRAFNSPALNSPIGHISKVFIQQRGNPETKQGG